MKALKRTYRCARDEHRQAVILVDGAPLNLRHDLHAYIPEGAIVEWRYPEDALQIALGVLADFTEDEQLAVSLHLEFAKWITMMPRNGLTFTGEFLSNWLMRSFTSRAKERVIQ